MDISSGLLRDTELTMLLKYFMIHPDLFRVVLRIPGTSFSLLGWCLKGKHVIGLELLKMN